uniref:CHK kinase-like domain-containing protein n=1 Tax=Anopheles culicifacies TaxID=139723 RepID=A0A182MJ54_9DIPT
MQCPRDENDVPEWLNDEFFLHVIREFLHDSGARLCHGCKLRPGTKPGEHFASVMYRTTIHYRCHRGKEASLDVIMKIKPYQAGLKKEVLEEGDLFAREIQIYSKVLPEMKRRLEEIGETFNYPRLVFAAEHPYTILMLENVSGKGWKTGGYITSFEEIIPAIKSIAQFHAASVVMEQDHRCNVAQKLKALNGMLTKSFQDLLHYMQNTEGFEHLIQPVEKLQGTLLNKLVESYTPSSNCLNVLVHGDFHSKNLLHQYTADGRVCETMLIDYQICSWTTPAVDLYYLLDTIVDQTVKEQHREGIIYLYSEEFRRLLHRLGWVGRVTSLQELHMELLRKGAIELFHYIALYAYRFVDRSKIDFEALLAGKATNPAASSPVYRRVMREVLTRFLHQVLCEYERDPTVRLVGPCELRPGTKAGDHFASVMYRTTVRYEIGAVEKAIHLIMKIKPMAEGLKKDLLKDDDFFGKEIRMYTRVLPEMARLMESIGEEYKYPRLIYASQTPHTIIILENVSPQGWTMKGLLKSFEEMQPTIDAIAKFHAASVVMQQKDPNFTSQYGCTIADTLRTMHKMTDACFEAFVRFLRDTLELPELVEPVLKFHQRIDKCLSDAYATTDACANVLIHGDFHFKNLLHLESEGTIVETMFVDYQMCSWSSQVVDLFYLTYMIPEQSVKSTHRDAIIHRYYQTFSSILRRLNYAGRVPSLSELHAEMLRKGELELFHYIVFSAFRYTDLSKVDSEAFFLGRIENPALQLDEFKATMRTELWRFLYQGVIE